ncbi:pyridoxamine 5'-phosphate oxidase family protein [Pseudazoarcus pumilus]|uniref:Pyridoxamine 5'-phosphate oxidase putative domain-containing protein n=1 Tax=Pseudazoarcus pumilus TaxID=2067960 RepID=A0A2I6S2M7_9RHOO|nr:pyridoxamine 5'-phosphate oxidase family protein [Pseudazoarcus pumilus]AUN93467.1 hypothetical protein C0099_00065 [Pseudazoarcus pumilus]
MNPPQAVRIDDELARFIGGEVSISVGSCDAARLPNLTRGFGCRVCDGHERIRIFVSRAQSRAVLADLATNRRIAVVFTLPATHRTVQFKGTDARVLSLADGDLECVRRYREGFVAHLAALGFGADTVAHMVGCPDDELAAIEFTPDAAFTQTPGPRAGQPLRQP